MRLALLLSLLVAPIARADVLFLDMNASYHEIGAAEAAAKKSGRRFAAFPPMEAAERKKLYDLSVAQEPAAVKLLNACSKDQQTDACKKARKAAEDLGDRLSAMKQKHAFSKEGLEKYLKEQQAAGKTFSSVVVSGHNGTGHLSGHLGRISEINLAKALEGAGMKDSIRSLHLWGCYTASPGSVMMNWKPHFPNVNFISGYDDRAPLSDKPAGWAYLKGVIERESQLHQVGDAKKLREALRKIPGALQVSSAISNCGLYANNKEAYDLEEYVGQCQKYKTELETRNAKFECYLQATEEGCENPPEDTSRGLIREYYGILQKTDPCTELTPDPIFAAHSRDQALLLLFNKSAMGNLARVHAKELRETDEILSSLGAPDSLRLADINTLTRKDALARLDSLLAFIRDRMPDLANHPESFKADVDAARLATLLGTHRALTRTLAKFDKQCAPYSWHEPGSQERSSCLDAKTLGHQGVQLAEGTGAKRTRNLLYNEAANRLSEEIRRNRQDPYSNLIRQARLSILRAETSDPDSKAAAEADLEWAKTVVRLKEAGVEKPLEHPEARTILYRNIAAQWAKEAAQYESPKDGSEVVEDEEATLAKVFAAASQERLALMSPDLKEEERAKLQASYDSRKKETQDRMYESDLKHTESQLSGLDRRLPFLLERAPNSRNVRNMQREQTRLRTKLEKLRNNPDAIKKTLWDSKLEALPFELEVKDRESIDSGDEE